jgi:hypothetical protein
LAGFFNIKLQKKHTAFFVAIPLLLTTAVLDTNCPVCGGDGSVSNNVAMESLKVTRVEAKEIGIKRNTCGLFLMYNYEVKISIENSGTTDARGWVQLYLIDYKEGKRLDTQYTVVEIPRQTSWEVSYGVWFISGTDQPQKTEVMADVFTGQVPCDSCGGKGKVTLNVWPIAKTMKEKFIQTAQVEKPWDVPPWPVDLE